MEDPSPLRKGERNMSENKKAVKDGMMSAKDGSIKVVVFSAPKSPPLLGAKAVRCALAVADLHSPPNAPPSPSPTGERRRERAR